MEFELAKVTIAADLSHHLIDGKPLYAQRFREVLKFHEPGLAAVLDSSGAYHIEHHGKPAYHQRYLRTFGFYDGRAAVIEAQSQRWFHILPSGAPLAPNRYDWCGNFQDQACPVRDHTGSYWHIDLEGQPLYSQKYQYAGDFKDGVAVVQNQAGLSTHIDRAGNYLHGIWYRDLDLFHKGFARACDAQGWCHINKAGQPSYRARYRMVEPFYNGWARVEDDYGALLLIQEDGKVHKILRQPSQTPLQQLSADLVGYWKTQTIKAAVELGIFDLLPNDEETLALETKLAPEMVRRLLRALQELKLIAPTPPHITLTDKGALLQTEHRLSLAAAARHWGAEPYLAWLKLPNALRQGHEAYSAHYGQPVFEWLEQDPATLQLYHTALASYARHDYQDLADQVELSAHQTVIDAGGGQGELLHYLLQKYRHLKGVLLERPALVRTLTTQEFAVQAFDLFTPWPQQGDAIFLARVLHDWDDQSCLTILQRAKEALLPQGAIYLVERLLEEDAGNGGLLDLNMLVLTGGRERTRAQFEALAAQAGLELRTTSPLARGATILKFMAAQTLASGDD